MSARAVHEILAAGVARPDLIERWRTDPRVLLDHGIEPASMDFSGLWKFAGLTVKVRHNAVRNLLPQSFRFMGAVGLEIDLFASYASHVSASGHPYAETTLERGGELIAYIERWLEPGCKEHVLLWDLIRHEQALAALAGLPTSRERPDRDALGPEAPPSGSSIPRIRGRVILHEMQSDPRIVASMLSRRPPDWEGVPLATRRVAYWRPDRSGDVRIAELDEFGYCALERIDGARSAAELSTMLVGSSQPTPGFFRLLDQLAQVGIIRIEAAASSAA